MSRGVVVIGGSPADRGALTSLLSALPLGFPLPVVVAINGDGASGQLDSLRAETRTLLPMKAIEDKDPLLAGQIHVAPRDYHLLVGRDVLSLTTEAAVKGQRPSIEVLCDSVADAYGSEAIAIALSCSGEDGRHGLERIHERGGLALEENPRPAAVSDVGTASNGYRRLPLADIAMILSSLRA